MLQVCRQYNIERWPFRKRSSLDRLIVKTRQYFAEDKQQQGGETLARLEAEKEAMKVGGKSQWQCCWLESYRQAAVTDVEVYTACYVTWRAMRQVLAVFPLPHTSCLQAKGGGPCAASLLLCLLCWR